MTTLEVREAVERALAGGVPLELVRERLVTAGLIRDEAAEERARLRREGPVALGEKYLPETFYGSRSPLIDHLNDWHVAEADRKPGDTHAVAAPRGHAKSTAGVEGGALWHAALCTRRFQVIVSNTDEQARERVQAIKAVAESNDELRELFPRLRPAATYGELGTWRENDLVFACGCRIIGMGAGSAARGLKHRAERPTLLYLDDLEDEKSVSTAYQIEKRLKWLTRSALALGSPIRGMSALWVGTILSRDSLLNLATGAALDEGQQRPRWAQAWAPSVYRAELDGTPEVEVTVPVEDPVTGAVFEHTRRVREPMWSDLTREDLAKIAGRVGDAGYAAEYMADPVDRTGGMIPAPLAAEWLNPDAPPLARMVRTSTGLLVSVASMIRVAALDPQFARPGEGGDPDLAAVAVIGQHGAHTFILDSWIGRDRDGQANTLVTKGLAWGCTMAAVEKNGAQVLVADQAQQLSSLTVVAEPSTEGKAVRALSFIVRAQQKRVFLLPGGHNDQLPAYLTAFPNGRYDDPVDAVVMGTNLATRLAPVAASGSAGPVAGGGREATG